MMTTGPLHNLVAEGAARVPC